MLNSTHSNDFDICIIGGGAIGLACAFQLSKNSRILLVERQSMWGNETSSRSSEVIHAGLYYPQGSLKERLCLRGKSMLYDFCNEHGVRVRAIGKLIVAPSKAHPKLQYLAQQAERLNIPIERWDRSQIRQAEPQVQAAEALWSPTTGIFDSHQYLQKLAELAANNNTVLMQQTEFLGAQAQQDNSWQIHLNSVGETCVVKVGTIINCGGLAAQTIAAKMSHGRASDTPSDNNTIVVDDSDAARKGNPLSIPRLQPCRGHYFSYSGPSPFQHLIYPLPEQGLTGLGIHATLDLQGNTRFGPDSQLLPEPESHQEPRYDYAIDDNRQLVFEDAIRQYFPTLDSERLHPSYAGIRPRLWGKAGHISDFEFVKQQIGQCQAIHCFGIESPGLTASLAIADYLKRQLSSAN